ncbi:hypothetical protein SteCoe_17114 [Stentor coeruleus]|uniref:Uncharacterized protein n=1 Tax=Stentor coeruleus TaxID=5963 RepID=A0A1R2BZL3_9CILI|nr:hypothetical protein SteCoe_17114 [Stentor coeruleus]
MSNSELSWEIPFLYRIRVFKKENQILSSIENFLNGRVITSPIFGLNKAVFQNFLKTKSSSFQRYFKVIPCDQKLVFHNGLQGGGCGNSRSDIKNVGGNVDRTQSHPNHHAQINGTAPQYYSQTPNPVGYPAIAGNTATVVDDFELIISPEEVKGRRDLQRKAAMLADQIADSMRTGTLDAGIMDQLLEISPYQCMSPFSITAIIINGFDCENLWMADFWIEERAKLARICRKFMMADYNINKDRTFQSNEEKANLMKKMENIKTKINRNMSKLPEICTLLEINVIIRLVSRARSTDSAIIQILKHCKDVFQVLIMIYKKELGGAVTKIIEYLKKSANFLKASYEEYLYYIDVLENAREIDPGSGKSLEGFIVDELSKFSKMSWEKQHILIGFVCTSIVKNQISLEYSLNFIGTEFRLSATSKNENLRQKAAVCIRYFLGSTNHEIKEQGKRYRSLMHDDEKKEGIKKMLNFPPIITENSNILRTKTSKQFDFHTQLENVRGFLKMFKSGNEIEKIEAKEKIKEKIEDSKSQILSFSMKKRNELIRDIGKIKSLLMIKQNKYKISRENIISDEDWAEVAKIQSQSKLKDIKKLLDEVNGKRASRETKLDDIKIKLEESKNEEKTRTFDLLLKAKGLNAEIITIHNSVLKESEENKPSSGVLTLSREMLANEILGSSITTIDFSKSTIKAEQKEAHADRWYDKVTSEFDELEFSNMINISEDEGSSLIDNQKKKWTELNMEYKKLNSEVKEIVDEVDKVELELNDYFNKLDKVELELNDYFNKLNSEKPKVIQKIKNAKDSLEYMDESLNKLKTSNEKCQKAMKKLVKKIQDKHPEIKLATDILSEYSTDPLTYIKRNQKEFERFKSQDGKYDVQAIVNSKNVIGPISVYPSGGSTGHNPYSQAPNPYSQAPNPYSQASNSYQNRPPGANPGYPPSVNPGYPPGASPGYPPGISSGYPPNVNPSYPPNTYSGYPPSSNPGYPQGANPGYPQNAYPGYPQNNSYQGYARK